VCGPIEAAGDVHCDDGQSRLAAVSCVAASWFTLPLSLD